jgi:hypothetical protein
MWRHARGRAAIALTCLLVGVAGRLEAQTSTAAEVLADKLKPGDRLTITVTDLTRIRGKLVAVGDDGLVMNTDSGEQVVPFEIVDRVSRRRFGVLLGPLIGAGVGIGFAIPVAMLFQNEGADATTATAFLVGVGAGAGLLIDAAINLPRTVYRRHPRARVQIAPQVGRDRRGIAMQVTF